MEDKQKKQISQVREFNRYYTNILGLLNQHILDSDLSLSEVRVLYEIEKIKDCTAKKLSKTLLLDTGYLSRMLKMFQKNNLIEKYKSPEDGRALYLTLSALGRDRLNELDAKSDEQISRILNPCSEKQREELVVCMRQIEKILETSYVND
ncbi:MAG: MarR family winged helix-turn-helix transcriptional regulator [Spirochaetales bacterium]|nr:MarR family winged helix-turn-helix transcriptional regulator [Spirochaetales bacterium]